MSRKIKNIIMIFLCIVLIGSMAYTMMTIQNSSNNATSFDMNQQTPPNMNQNPGFNDNDGTPPSLPKENNSANDSNATPPALPDGENKSDNSFGGNPGSMEEPPAKPDGDTSQGDTPPSMPDNNHESMMPGNNQISQASSLDIMYYVIFGVESLLFALILVYLVMSKLNAKSLTETFGYFDKFIIFILATIILTASLTFSNITIANHYFLNNTTMEEMQPGNPGSNESTVDAKGSIEIDATKENLTDSYETSEIDTSVILVKNGGTLNLSNATINKTGGDSSNTENSEFYGVNAGILVTKNSNASIDGANITTNASGSNAVFSTGTDSKTVIKNSTITTTGSSSARGLDATYGGTIEADQVTIKTQGGSCATLATDRGEGTVTVSNSDLETNGSGSPVIYSTGAISIDNTKGIANGAQMVVIEGKNSATVSNSTLQASGAGNRKDIDQAGIMIYQSMSGDASEGTGTLTVKDSTLEIQSNSNYYKSAPMFFITNTDAIINIENTVLNYGSNLLISAKGTSEWGRENQNGGNLTCNAVNQTLVGNIEIDAISTLSLNLAKSSYQGTINKDNTAKNIVVTLDKDSTLTLTGDCYISELNNEDTSNANINFNGYALYVNNTQIN